MFRTIFSVSSILAVAQAIAVNTASKAAVYSPWTLAQTQSTAGHDQCCCQYMPCMPTCQTQCEKKEPPAPEPVLTQLAPTPVRDVVLNLDVILTHILHEVHPTPESPEIVMPEPGSPDETEFVNNVLTPIVIQLINNDIVPALPTCTFPEGTSAADWGVDANGQEASGKKEVHADTDAVLRGVLEQVMDGMTLPEGADKKALIDAAIPSEDVVSHINVESEDGQHEIEMIVTGLTDSVSQFLDGDKVTADTEIPQNVSDLADAVGAEIEEAGVDAGENAVSIEEIIDEAVSGDDDKKEEEEEVEYITATGPALYTDENGVEHEEGEAQVV